MMEILNATKAGIVGHIEGKPIRQYDDSITVLFDSEAERIANKTIEYEGTLYYYGTANRQHDNTYVALYWKTRPVW